jgi:hypothetical protein
MSGTVTAPVTRQEVHTIQRLSDAGDGEQTGSSTTIKRGPSKSLNRQTSRSGLNIVMGEWTGEDCRPCLHQNHSQLQHVWPV